MGHIESELTESLPCIEERRCSSYDDDRGYDRLNLAQKFSVSKLSQFGYQLHFVRGELLNTMAILKNAESVITVDYFGELNIAPNILLRING